MSHLFVLIALIGWCVVLIYAVLTIRKQCEIVRSLEEVFSEAEHLINFARYSEDKSEMVVDKDDFRRLRSRIFQFHEEK